MDKNELKARSKFLSNLLRHKPDVLDPTIDAQGWVAIDEIIEKSERPATRDQIEEIAVSNTRQRFAISADGEKIRADQGHSIPIDLGLSACRRPEILFNGTAANNVEVIRTEGLTRRSRHHVHLSPGAETARQVGMRHGKPVVLVVEAGKMHSNGHVFLLSENGVWLCDQVPPEFLRP